MLLAMQPPCRARCDAAPRAAPLPFAGACPSTAGGSNVPRRPHGAAFAARSIAAGAAVQDQSSRRAILSIVLSMASYVVGDVVLKLLGAVFPPSELIFWRSVIIAVALGAVLLWIRPRFLSRSLLSGPVLLRCLFDCVNILSFTTAVIHMNLAELYAVLQMSPFLMTVLAVVFFREPVGWRRWLAVAAGFGGVLLIIKPDPGNFNTWALLGIVAAFGAACRELVTGRIDPSVPTLEVTFLSALFAAVGTFIFGLRDPWPAMNHGDVMLLLLQATSWVIGTFLLVHGIRSAPLSLVAPFRYSLLVWGGFAGYVVFGDLPDALAMCGAAIIVLSGLYIFHREAVRRRALTSTVTTVT
jgi:drug/metabolite transporter (DMT)-like permease